MQELSEMVFEKKGIPVTSSLIIAEKAKIQHESVVKMITTYMEDLMEFGAMDFSDLKSGKRGRPVRTYELNERQATVLLTYLSNTAPVRKFKKDLVKAFFEMAEIIKSLQSAKLEFPAFTTAIMDAHEEPKHYHFSNEINMINKIVLGVTASKYKEQNGIDKKVSSIRPYLSLEEISAIEELQRVDIGLIVSGMEYDQRKQVLSGYYNRRILGIIMKAG